MQEILVNSKFCNLKFCDILNFSFNLRPIEEKIIQIYTTAREMVVCYVDVVTTYQLFYLEL
jgi:hypothetical protein